MDSGPTAKGFNVDESIHDYVNMFCVIVTAVLPFAFYMPGTWQNPVNSLNETFTTIALFCVSHAFGVAAS